MEWIQEFFTHFDWDGFWLNFLVSFIFFLVSLLAAIKIIPYYTLQLIKSRNKKHIDRRISAIVQEICKFLNRSPYRDSEVHQNTLSLYNSLPGKKDYRFVSFSKINVLSEIVRLKIFIAVSEHFQRLDIRRKDEVLKCEYQRLSDLRVQIENILSVHSLHLDEEIISETSEICLDIQSFEWALEFNRSNKELFGKQGKEVPGVAGVGELAEIYQKLSNLLYEIILKSKLTTEIEKS